MVAATLNYRRRVTRSIPGEGQSQMLLDSRIRDEDEPRALNQEVKGSIRFHYLMASQARLPGAERVTIVALSDFKRDDDTLGAVGRGKEHHADRAQIRPSLSGYSEFFSRSDTYCMSSAQGLPRGQCPCGRHGCACEWSGARKKSSRVLCRCDAQQANRRGEFPISGLNWTWLRHRLRLFLRMASRLYTQATRGWREHYGDPLWHKIGLL